MRYVETEVKLDAFLTLAPDVREWSAPQSNHVVTTEKPTVPIWDKIFGPQMWVRRDGKQVPYSRGHIPCHPANALLLSYSGLFKTLERDELTLVCTRRTGHLMALKHKIQKYT